jgi:gluconate kinase
MSVPLLVCYALKRQRKAQLTLRTPKDCFLLRSASYEGQDAIIILPSEALSECGMSVPLLVCYALKRQRKAQLTLRTPKDCFLLRSASYEGQDAIIILPSEALSECGMSVPLLVCYALKRQRKAQLTLRTPKDCFLLRSASYEGQDAIIILPSEALSACQCRF